MAKGPSNEELKQKARSLIGRGRVELDAEIHALQWTFKPRNLARSALTRAPAIVISGAFLVGVVIAMKIYNPTHEEEPAQKRSKKHEEKPRTPLVVSLMRNALSAAIPTIVRNIVTTAFQKSEPAQSEWSEGSLS